MALKVLPPDKVADWDRKQRFTQEAEAASALNHPHIITIYDIASEGGVDFIAMEYVAGKTLDQLIPRKGMRLTEALKIAVQVADALAAAHGAGIVHRDIKPSNVMVSDQGRVKVLDFGLVKLTGRDDSCQYVYYVQRSPPGLFRMPVAGGEGQQVLPRLSSSYNFAVGVKGVYFTPDARTIQLLDVATGKVSTGATLDKDALGICVSPDDRYVVWSQLDRETRDLMLIERFR